MDAMVKPWHDDGGKAEYGKTLYHASHPWYRIGAARSSDPLKTQRKTLR